MAAGPHAGHLRTLISTIGRGMPMRKTKAHRTIEDAVDADDARDIVGNKLADTAANFGAACHPQPSKVEVAEAVSRWTFLCDLVQAAASMAAAWPSIRSVLGGRAARATGSNFPRSVARRILKSSPPPDKTHAFKSFAGTIMCDRCLAITHSWAGARQRQRCQPCPGHSVVMRQAMESQELGHALVLGVFDGRPTICCTACGRFATARLEGLAGVCFRAEPGSKGQQAINRLLRGEHPDVKKRSARGEAWFRVLSTELQEFTPGGA